MNSDEKHSKMSDNNYTKFVLMLAASFIAMYITMYLNSYEIDHVYFSLTRFYMSCLGIAAMAIIMFVAMRGMYQNKKKNIGIVLGSIILFFSALGLVRAQAPIIGDILWMKAMIPHHSIAIFTRERADIQRPGIQKMGNEDKKTQKRGIGGIKAMNKRLQEN